MATKKNIVLVDDHVIIRNGLKELIEKLGPYHIAHQFDNGLDFTNALPSIAPPDLVMMDISMPEMNGEEVVDHLLANKIELPILILSLNEDEKLIIRLFKKGVRGYLKKSCTAAMMKKALEEIFNFGYYHNELLTYALRNIDTPGKSQQEQILDQLTAKEKEFLGHICHPDEYTYEQIAGLMNMQYRTIDGYRESLFEKFGIKSKTGLVLFVLRHNLYEHIKNKNDDHKESPPAKKSPERELTGRKQ